MAEKKSTSSKSTSNKSTTSKSTTTKKTTTSKSTSSKSTSTGKSSTKTNVNRVVKAAQKVDTNKSFKDNKEALAGVVVATATSAKRAQNKKQRKVFVALTVILIIAIIAVGIYGYFNGWYNTIIYGSDGYVGGDVYSEDYNTAVIAEQNLSIHFLDLGNKYVGDSVYIKAGDTDILIDAGSRQGSAEAITDYINQYVKDNKLEYVIATHAHEDHLAGFYSTSKVKGVFENFKTDTIIDFALSAKTANGATVGANTVLGKYQNALQGEIAEGATHYTAAECFNEENGAKRTYQVADGIELEVLYNYYYFNYDTSSTGKSTVAKTTIRYALCSTIPCLTAR